MQKTVAISTLQSLVSDHNKPIYQEALDCIKTAMAEALKPTHNTASTPCEHDFFVTEAYVHCRKCRITYTARD